MAKSKDDVKHGTAQAKLSEDEMLPFVPCFPNPIVIDFTGGSTWEHLSTKIINIASEFSPWKLAEVAAIYLTPFYRQLCHSGDLGALNEELVDMIRDASVQLSQEGQ
ncbi:hypothetical protein Peur_023394 [Populus x canadensis]